MTAKAKETALFSLVKGAGISFIGSASGNALRILYLFFLASFLTQADLGLFVLGYTVVKFLGVISLLGFDTGILRYVALYNGVNDFSRMNWTVRASLWFSIPFSLFVAVLIFLNSEKIALDLFSEPSLTVILQYFTLCIPFFTLMSINVIAMQAIKLMQYKVYCKELAENIIKFILTGVIFLFHWDLGTVVLTNVIAIVITSGISFYFYKKVFPIVKVYRQPATEFLALLKYSIPNSFSQISSMAINWTDILMLGYFAAAKDVGLYRVSSVVPLIGVIFLDSFTAIFSPMISDLYNRREYSQLNNLFKIVTKWIFTFSLPFFILVIFYADSILKFWGSQYLVGVPCLVILTLGQIINSATGSVGYVLTMSGHSWINLLNNFVVCLLNITLNYILIPRYSIVGAAIATAVSISTVNLLRLFEVFLMIRIHPYNLAYCRPLLTAMVSTGILIFLTESVSVPNNYLGMISGAFIFLSSYISILFLMKLDKEDLLVLRLVRKKVVQGFSSRPGSD